MFESIIIAAIVFIISFGVLLEAEKIIHRLTHNPDRSYRWGVWVFSILAAAYAFLTSLGRR